MRLRGLGWWWHPAVRDAADPCRSGSASHKSYCRTMIWWDSGRLEVAWGMPRRDESPGRDTSRDPGAFEAARSMNSGGPRGRICRVSRRSGGSSMVGYQPAGASNNFRGRIDLADASRLRCRGLPRQPPPPIAPRLKHVRNFPSRVLSLLAPWPDDQARDGDRTGHSGFAEPTHSKSWAVGRRALGRARGAGHDQVGGPTQRFQLA